MHAVPGGGSAKLNAGKISTAPVGFAGVSSAVEAPNGALALRLVGTGGKTLARTSKNLGDGRYTVVATKRGDDVTLLVFRDQDAKKGRATLRVIHAAPELGNTDVTADRTDVATGLAFEDASPYADLEPGTYRLEAMRPSGQGGALATKSGVNLEAGTSATAVLAGSGGQPTTFVVASDAAAAPTKAPQTGLGGLSGDTPWLAAVLAALGAGALGGVGYRLAIRRGG